MTTPLEFSLLERFSFILPVLVIYAGSLGVLMRINIFGKLINHILSIAIGLMMLFIPSLLEVIQFAVPWMVVVGVIGLTLMGIAKFFGVPDKAIAMALGREQIMYWFIAAFVIIMIAALGKVYFGPGDFLGSGSSIDAINEGEGGTTLTGEIGFWNVIFHPAVLGLIALMLISVFTVALITG